MGTAYWMWLGENREKIAKSLGSAKASDVAKKAGEMWKILSAAERAPFEKKAKMEKDAYDRLISTDEGQKALAEKKAAKAEANAEKAKKEEERAEKLAAKEERKNERACNSASKSIVKDDALKKPQSAYWLWLGDNREEIASAVGSSKVSDVAKKAGEMWKGLSDAARAPYENKAKEQKKVYDAYIASEEGAAALRAFKDAKQATKNQFKPQSTEDGADGSEKKRKVEEAGEAEGKDVAAKQARKSSFAKLGA